MADFSRLPGPNADLWDWQLVAACRGVDSSLFFHPEGERGAARSAREAAAKEVCMRCPVRADCATHALAVREPYGVWGGLTEDEREAMMGRSRHRAGDRDDDDRERERERERRRKRYEQYASDSMDATDSLDGVDDAGAMEDDGTDGTGGADETGGADGIDGVDGMHTMDGPDESARHGRHDDYDLYGGGYDDEPGADLDAEPARSY
jgi:hypothetical protein